MFQIKSRRRGAALCLALVLGLCGGLFAACGSRTSSSSAPSSEITSPRTVSSGPAASEAAVISSAAPASSAASAPVSSAPSSSVVYENAKYGLRVALPADWKGYQVLTQQWGAFKVSDPTPKDTVFGPELVIRSPKWTREEPYQDIPIMIFTPEQWKDLSGDVLHIGAAPIGPRELAKNSKYVFALPARYNFAFPEGYEEVEKIIGSGAVTAFEWTL